MYVVAVSFIVKSEVRDRFVSAVRENAKISLESEVACHQFDVCQSPKDENEIFLYEVYENKEAFDVHLASMHFLNFDSLVKDWVVSKDIAIFHRFE